MTTLSAEDQARLVELLDHQLTLFHELRRLTEHQSEMVAQQRAEPLLEVLAQRQDIISRITEVSTRLTPYRQRWDQIRRTLPSPAREQVEERVQQVEDLLAGILAQDEQDRRQLEGAQASVRQEASRTARSGVALKAYRATMNGAGPTNRQG